MSNETKTHKGGVVTQIHERVQDGERKTIAEWAAEYGLNKRQLTTRLTRARGRGMLLYSNYIPGSKEAGILVDILNDQEDFRVVSGRYDEMLVLPSIHRAFEIIEQGFSHFPQLRNQLRKRMELIAGKVDTR